MDVMNQALALPVAAVLLLTFGVWIYLLITRVGYMRAHNISAERLKTPADAQALIPGEASAASNNFKNLLEMPVVFYVVCLYLTVFGLVDSVHLGCAWVFVAGRVVHSLIHCTYNKVMHRFVIYLVSSFAVWIMVVRAFMAAL